MDFPILDFHMNRVGVDFFDWFLSLSVMCSGFFPRCNTHQYSVSLFVAKYPIVWVDHILFTHSSVDGHSGYFHLKALINNVTINTHVQVFVWT